MFNALPLILERTNRRSEILIAVALALIFHFRGCCRRDCDPNGIGAGRDRSDYSIGRSINDGDRMDAIIGNINSKAVRRDGHSIWQGEGADRNRRNHSVSRRVDHKDPTVSFIRHVRSCAVGRDGHHTITKGERAEHDGRNSDSSNNGVGCRVDDGDRAA